jgi:Tfp pilus assembly protein PilF
VGIVVVIALAASIAMLERPRESATRPEANPDNPANPQAKEFYLRGINEWNDRSMSALDSAVIYFRKATESEPTFARAHAGLANAYVMIGYSGYRPADAMFPKAKAAALRAIEIDSTLAAPYAALGMELTWERKFNAAESAYRKAIALEPSYATAHQWYGILLMILGDTQRAVEETGKAADLDPLSLQIQNNYATFLSASGQNEAALRQYQRVVGEEPDSAWVRRNPWLLTNMASIYASNGRFDKATKFAEQAVAILPGHPRAALALAGALYRSGKKSEATAAFAKADTTNEHYPAYRALMYVTEGQPDSAFFWFDHVKDWGIPILISVSGLRHSPVIGNDPRLRILFSRLGIPASAEPKR